MTGEMSKADVTEEAFPVHFAIAAACGGTVKPFDVYQGPYILTPTGERLFLSTDDGYWVCVWNERTNELSTYFPMWDETAQGDGVNAAHEVYSFA